MNKEDKDNVDDDDEDDDVLNIDCHELYDRRREFSRRRSQMMTDLRVEESKLLVMIKIMWTMIMKMIKKELCDFILLLLFHSNSQHDAPA